MKCDHKTCTTPFCPNCGKQLVLPAVQSLREHIDSNIERITDQLRDEPDSKHAESRRKAADKWVSWLDWVVQAMEKTDASK